MARHRSPNCPTLPFADAIEKGRKVYEKEHTHPAAKLIVAQDLGYKGLSGPSLALLGALRQYGILEGTGEALRVSKDALAYYEMDDGPEKAQSRPADDLYPGSVCGIASTIWGQVAERREPAAYSHNEGIFT